MAGRIFNKVSGHCITKVNNTSRQQTARRIKALRLMRRDMEAMYDTARGMSSALFSLCIIPTFILKRKGIILELYNFPAEIIFQIVQVLPPIYKQKVKSNKHRGAMKNAVFWDVVPCRYCRKRRFGGMCCIRPQRRRNLLARDRAISWEPTVIAIPSSRILSSLKMEATRSSHDTYTALHPHSQSHRRENLKCYTGER
jgi:hypothetical protein